MTPERIALFRAFLIDCSDVYGIGNVDEDLDATAIAAGVLATPAGQKKAAHMRLARDMACWRSLRRIADHAESGPVFSLGFASWLALLGWFCDRAPAPQQRLQAHDQGDWQPLCGMPSLRALFAGILGGVDRIDHCPSLVLPAELPPQASLLVSLAPQLPDDEERLVLEWLQRQRVHVRRIVLAAGRCDREPELWRRVCAALDIPNEPRLFRADGIADFAKAYPDKAAWGFRRTRDHLSRSSVLLGDAGGWHFLDAPDSCEGS